MSLAALEKLNYTIEHFDANILCSHAKSTGQINVPLHLHNHFEMNLYLEGDILFFIDGHSFKPTRGNLIIINNTQIHGPKSVSETVYERAIIHFSPRSAQLLSTETSDLLHCFQQVDEETRVIATLSEPDILKFVRLIDQLQEIENQGTLQFGDDILLNAYLAQLLVLANQNFRNEEGSTLTTNQHFPMIIHDVLDYIQSNLTEPLSLDIFEKKFAINRHYLNRLFKKELGISIYNYVILNRIAAAKKLLSKGMTPIEVSDALGFNDYSTFSRSFKKVTNFSPSNYVKSIL